MTHAPSLFVTVVLFTLMRVGQCNQVGLIRIQPQFLAPIPENTDFHISLNYTRLVCDVMMIVRVSDANVLSVRGTKRFSLLAIPPNSTNSASSYSSTTTHYNHLNLRSNNIGSSLVSFDFTKPDNSYLQPLERPDIGAFSVTVVKRVTLADQTLGYISIALVYLSVIVMGSEVKLGQLQHLMQRPGCVGAAQITNMIIQPFMAFLLSKLFSLSPAESLYLVMVGCCPAGANSNMFCLVSHGEITLSFVVTFMSTFMCMGWMPLNLFTYSNFIAGDTGVKSVNDVNVPYGRMVINMVKLLIPILCGMLLRYFFPSTDREWFRRFRWIVAASLFVSSLHHIYSTRFVTQLINSKLIAVACLLPLSGFLTGAILTLISRQRSSAIRTVLLGTGLQDTFLVVLIVRDLKKPPSSDLDCAIPHICASFALFYAFICYAAHHFLLAFSQSYSNLVQSEEAILLQEEGTTDTLNEQTKQQITSEPCQENTPNHISPREQLLNNRAQNETNREINIRNHNNNYCMHNRTANHDSVSYHALSSSAFSLNHQSPALHNNQSSYDATLQSPLNCSHEVELYNRNLRRPRSMFIDRFNSSNDQLNQTTALNPDQVMVVVGDNNANRMPINDYRTGIVVNSPLRHQNTNGHLPTENNVSQEITHSANSCSNSRRFVYFPQEQEINLENSMKIGSLPVSANASPGFIPQYFHPKQVIRSDREKLPRSKYSVGQNATVEFHV